jgi:hypothetical protein
VFDKGFIWDYFDSSGLSILQIFDYVRVLFYADDKKLFLLFSGFSGSEQTVGVLRQKLIAPQRW